MTLKRKLATAITSGALIFSSFATPAFAATITISGNGADSNNTANVSVNQSQAVVQNNSANITNNVEAEAETGENEANKNNGGDVEIDTGNATSNVTINNQVNSNSAKLNCCLANNTEVLISGNAADSENDAKLDWESDNIITQDNNADVDNNVEAEAETGENDANENNGGSVKVTTGNAKSNVDLSTVANLNWASMGANGSDDGPSLSLKILDNSARSDNDINVTIDGFSAIVQDNDADVDNNVEAEAETGDNEANENNGGDVEIDTGNAEVNIEVDNLVNFNSADTDCGCLLEDWELKIAGNAADSENDITLSLKDDKENGVFQDNNADVENNLDDEELEADTGDNEANENNAGGEDGDPEVTTGDAEVNVELTNEVNVNLVNSDDDLDFPDFGGLHLSFSFDLGDLLDALGL